MLLAISEFQETQLGVYRETIRKFDSKELRGEVCLLRQRDAPFVVLFNLYLPTVFVVSCL